LERVTIIGLGLIGTSIGLALKDSGILRAEIVGHDLEPSHENKAKKMGAVDKTTHNLIDAVENSRLIILATPVMAIKETLELIAPHLAPGSVVTDTGSTKAQVIEWAEMLLANGKTSCNFIGGHPMAGKEKPGPDNADADMFRGATYAVCPAPSSNEESAQAVVTMIEAIGGIPYFIDPSEHDSYVAAVSHLPFILSTALVGATTQSLGWREMSRLTGTGFRDISRLASGDPIMHRDICVTNVEPIVHWINEFLRELVDLRDSLQESHDSVELKLIKAWEARARWLAGRDSGERPGAELPKASDSMMNLMMGEKMAGRFKALSESPKGDPTKYRKR